MLRYTFSELLTIFFYTNTFEIERTKKALAAEIDVPIRTLKYWFSGQYTPRSANIVECIANVLWLNQVQTDLLLYSIDEKWIKYGTPLKQLESFNFFRYQESEVKQIEYNVEQVPAIEKIESEWNLIFQDSFDDNYQKWGTGMKDCGYVRVQKHIGNNRYTLRLQGNLPFNVMGGDSACQSPEIYYMKLTAKMIQGDTDDAGYGILFEEISDEYFALFRIREKQRKFSVVQSYLPGCENYAVYINQNPAISIRQKETNTLALLAIGDKHFFYINETLVGQCSIRRLPVSRLDVGIVSTCGEEVICTFQDFRVYIPDSSFQIVK